MPCVPSGAGTALEQRVAADAAAAPPGSSSVVLSLRSGNLPEVERPSELASCSGRTPRREVGTGRYAPGTWRTCGTRTLSELGVARRDPGSVPAASRTARLHLEPGSVHGQRSTGRVATFARRVASVCRHAGWRGGRRRGARGGWGDRPPVPDGRFRRRTVGAAGTLAVGAARISSCPPTLRRRRPGRSARLRRLRRLRLVPRPRPCPSDPVPLSRPSLGRLLPQAGCRERASSTPISRTGPDTIPSRSARTAGVRKQCTVAAT